MATVADAPRAVLLRPDDNVAVAARPIPKGLTIEIGGRPVEVREPIALGHKVALVEIAAGEPVRKYGQIIGFASRPIAAGAWVHVHNLRADLFERDYAFATDRPPVPPHGRGRAVRARTRPSAARPPAPPGTRRAAARLAGPGPRLATARRGRGLTAVRREARRVDRAGRSSWSPARFSG